jgi:hypothetical protein
MVFKYTRVVIVGHSLGGTYVPVLPRFASEIGELAILGPVVESKSCGSVEGEETNEDFLRSMKEDGYHYLFRGVLEPIWEDHLENRDDLSPMDNIAYLSQAKLFIGHGKLDACVHYSKSVKYFERILQMFPDKKEQFLLKIYEEGDHGIGTTNQAVQDVMDWFGFVKQT